MAYYFSPGVQLNAPPAVAGDLLVGRADGLFNRLAIGANGTFLNVSAGAIRWGNIIDAGGLTVTAGNLTLTAGSATIGSTLTVQGAAISVGATPAVSGQVRMGNNVANLAVRNGANTADITTLTVDAGNIVYIGGDGVNDGGVTLRSTAAFRFGTDNTIDIGLSASGRPRTGYFATSLVLAGSVAGSGYVRLPNLNLAAGMTSVNTAGNATLGWFVTDAANVMYIGDGTNDGGLTLRANGQINLNSTAGNVNVGYATTALGAGAAATLGTIGAPGPAVAGQNAWLAIKIAGVTAFLPTWV